MQQERNKQKQNLLRAQHHLKEIQFSCRDVIEMSRQLNLLSQQLQESEVNYRKIEFVKGEIKDKLKEYASFIDEIYKILDRKIIILTKDLQKQAK